MRVENSIKNAYVAILGQVINSLLAFLTRTVFIKILGSEYLGIEGLFINILSMLSLANLGFDSAISFSLYKPIKDNNIKEIKGYIELFGKVYRVVALVVFLVGVSVIPFLSKIINTDIKISENIILIYMLFLINTSLSYLYSYKQIILFASQKNYIISKIHSKFIIFSNSIQIVVLVIFKQYLLVLISQIVLRIAENIVVARRAEIEYPFLKDKDKEKLSKDKKENLCESVKAMFLYKVSGTIINSTDSIVISSFIGINFVGIYSNYLLIISTVKTFVSYVFYSTTASIGNLLCTNEKEKKEKIFFNIQFMSFWIYGGCSIILWCLINEFIGLWIGSKYLLSEGTILIIIINFYTEGMQSVVTMYRDTSGLFKVGKYKPIIAAVINVAISLLLVEKLHIAGVILGTIISRVCVYFWFDPYVITKYIFKSNCKKYFIKYCKYTLVVLVVGIVTKNICRNINYDNIYIQFVMRMGTSITIPNVIFFLINIKSTEMRYFKSIVDRYLHLKATGHKSAQNGPRASTSNKCKISD